MTLVALLLAAAPSWAALSTAERTQAMVELKQAPWPTRLALASERFLGTPYAVSPLGEGEGPDPDPLVRFDAVDCLTMVEESLALAAAPDDDRLVGVLNRVRYSGPPSYEARNHVMEAQWLPHLIGLGWLKGVTRDFGGRRTVVVKKVLSPATWEGALGRSLKLDKGAQALGEYQLDVIPAAAAVASLAGAPDGLVVAVVRADAPSKVTRISHVGVLIRSAQGPVLRHASSVEHRVIDEPLGHFLDRAKRGPWALVGLAVYQPTDALDGG